VSETKVPLQARHFFKRKIGVYAFHVHMFPLGLTRPDVEFVKVLWKSQFKCHASTCVVCRVQTTGLRTTMRVLYAGKKLVQTSKSKSTKDAGTVE
jgi:hypothetical protein